MISERLKIRLCVALESDLWRRLNLEQIKIQLDVRETLRSYIILHSHDSTVLVNFLLD